MWYVHPALQYDIFGPQCDTFGSLTWYIWLSSVIYSSLHYDIAVFHSPVCYIQFSKMIQWVLAHLWCGVIRVRGIFKMMNSFHCNCLQGIHGAWWMGGNMIRCIYARRSGPSWHANVHARREVSIGEPINSLWWEYSVKLPAPLADGLKGCYWILLPKDNLLFNSFAVFFVRHVFS